LGRIADLYAERTAGGCDAEILVTQATDQIKRLLRRLLLCESKRVGFDLGLDGGADMRRRTKEAVRGHQTLDALMRPLEVVVLDEELDPPKTVREVSEHRLGQKFLPQRLPEAFDLAERLRMLRPALAVRDATTTQQLLKLRRAAPRRVLPALVRQHLARLAVLRDAALERLDDQAPLLVMRHRPRHQVPRVVVHEAREIHALVTAQLEGEDVALPELVRLGAFEATRRLVTRLPLRVFDQQALLVQDASHRRLRHTQTLEAREHVANAPRAPLRVGCPCRNDLCARHRRRRLLCGRLLGVTELGVQRLHPATVKERHELLDHGGRHAKRHRGVSMSRPAHHRLDDADPHRERHHPLLPQPVFGLLFSLLLRHLFLSSAFRVSGPRTSGAMRTSAHETTH
jgi:hypothetical protein